MERETLKLRLSETRNKLKSICSDAHYAESLISDLISLKGQLDHVPAVEHVKVDDIIDDHQGDVFYVAKLRGERMLYKVYGGYTIICDSRQRALYETIEGVLMEAKSDDAESNEDVKVALSAIGYVLCAPMYAFSDETLTFKIAATIVEHIANIQTEAENSELKDDSEAILEEMSVEQAAVEMLAKPYSDGEDKY